MSEEKLICGCGGEIKVRFIRHDCCVAECELCEICSGLYTTEEFALAAFKKATRADIKQGINWIQVTERLPELIKVGKKTCTQSKWVFVTDGEKLAEAYYYDYTKRKVKPNYATGKGWYCHGINRKAITHWAEINLPKE